MTKYISWLLLLSLTACGTSSKSSKSPAPAPAPGPCANCPTAAKPVQPVAPTDKTLPKLVDFRQDGLQAVELEFSEPIRSSNFTWRSSAFGTPAWNEDRTKVRITFDITKQPELGVFMFVLDSITDDAGNRNNLGLTIPIDNRPPTILATQRIDERTWEITLDEDARLSDSTQIHLNEIYKLLPAAQETTDKTLRLTASGDEIPAGDAGIITVTDIADIHGNKTKKRAGRYISSNDHTAPAITAIKQLPRELIGKYPYSVFEIQFSEYVLDGRDTDELSGILGSLSTTLDGLQSFRLNGEDVLFFEVKWTRSADHRSALFKIPTINLKHMETNTIELNLMDITGNKAKSVFNFVPDARSPTIPGSYVRQDQCFMDGTRSFRCRLSEPDVKSANLGPEADWPRDSYATRVTEDVQGDSKTYWLHFDFRNDVPEKVIEEIEIVDAYENRRSDRSALLLFLPTTKKPELLSVSAFGSSLLEIRMTGGVESVDRILINGVSRGFTLTSEDELHQGYSPKNVTILFQEALPAGIYRVELQGIHRLRNKALRTDSIVLEALANTEPDIIPSTLRMSENDGQEIIMNLSASLQDRKLEIFVRTDFDADASQEVQLKDFTVSQKPINSSGTWPVHIRINAAEGLNVNQYAQPMVFRIEGRPATPVQRVQLSTEVPEFSRHYQSASPRFIGLMTNTTLNKASLQLELVEADGTAKPIPSEWISFEEGVVFYVRVTIPEDRDALKPGNYKLRVTSARARNFDLSIKEPFELDFKIN